YRSDIYAYEAKDEYKRRAEPFTSFTGAVNGEPTWLMYHLSVGSPVADFVYRRDEPLIVDYHNITPASYFERWEPVVTALLVTARLPKGARQLVDPEARTSLAIAHSSYSNQELRAVGYSPTAVVPVLFDIATFDAVAADPETSARLQHAKCDGGADWLFVGRL